MRFIIATLLLVFMAVPQANAGPFEEGMEAYRDKDYSKARELWLPMAEGGHTFAMNNVGMMYKNGLGLRKNFKKAVKMFRQSADQGFSLAQYNLAGMYQSGKGVKKNRKKAVFWMLKAANSKFSKAQRKMGFWAEKGYGMKKDPVKALEWYYIAQSNTKGGRLRDIVDKAIAKLEPTVSATDIAKAKEDAENFVPGV